MKHICEALNLSESGYYRYLKSLDRQSKEQLLSVGIQKILDTSEYNDNYGVLRMQKALRSMGIKAGLRRIRNVMKAKGLLRRKKKYVRREKPDNDAVCENRIMQDFRSDKPYRKLLGDITQIRCGDGILYVSAMLDCFNGEIVGLQMSDNMKKELVMDTVNMAEKMYPIRGCVFHSDRGSQYTSEAFRSRLKELNITQSMSGAGCCYDNARMESFFATLKKELLYRRPVSRMRMQEVKSMIFRYVFGYYNTMRINTANPDWMPPAVYRRWFEEFAY